MPYHRAIDHARERLRGAGAIGTTGRGIGPAYEDKMARTGIRVGDLFDEAGFREALERSLREKNGYLEALLGERAARLRRRSYERVRRLPRAAARPSSPTRAPSSARRIAAGAARAARGRAGHDARRRPRHVPVRHLVELRRRARPRPGAGLPPRAHRARHRHREGVHDARRRAGPFPTELTDALGERLRADGDEYGATTGRPRRCGWFDAVVVRQAVALSGVDGLARHQARRADRHRPAPGLRRLRARRPPPRAAARHAARRGSALTPVYEELPGWREPLGGARALDDLPANARRYLERLTALVGAPLALVSVGAQRDQTIQLGV